MQNQPEITLTIFKGIKDNRTDKRMSLTSFDAFEDMLHELTTYRRKSKRSAQLISPAWYKRNTTRANANVEHWGGWCAVDVDEHNINASDIESYLQKQYGQWRYVCYSTASSTVDKPKFRMVFPLTKNVPADQIKKFWYALNTELNSIGDRQTKDLSRMYYIPGNYDNAYNFMYFNRSGMFIDPDHLIAKYPLLTTQRPGATFFERLPEAIRKVIIEHRKNKLENNNMIRWNTYRDCPFVNREMLSEYLLITETGWYHKSFQLMCSIASRAIKMGYPITANEVATLFRQIDADHGNWYVNRPLEKEADRAIEFVYSKG